MDGDAVVTTHCFAAGVNDPNLGLDAFGEANGFAVWDVDHPTCAAHAHARAHDQEECA